MSNHEYVVQQKLEVIAGLLREIIKLLEAGHEKAIPEDVSEYICEDEQD